MLKLHESLIEVLENNLSEEQEQAQALDREGVISHMSALGLSEISDRLVKNERLYVHAGFARPESDPEIALAGWKSLVKQWDKTRFAADLVAARHMLGQAMTAENESRVLALKQMQLDQDED